MERNGDIRRARGGPGWLPPLRGIAAAALVLAGLAFPGAPRAEFADRTFLVAVTSGSPWSGDVRAAGRGGYDLAGGARVDLHDWYRAERPGIAIGFLTALGPRTGLLWSVASGESGEKYRVAPGLMLGLLHREPLGRHGAVVLRAETMLGGALEERPCTADYGAIGGVQPVNCRLAASPLPPEETLDYLLRRSGWEATRLSLGVEFRF